MQKFKLVSLDAILTQSHHNQVSTLSYTTMIDHKQQSTRIQHSMLVVFKREMSPVLLQVSPILPSVSLEEMLRCMELVLTVLTLLWIIQDISDVRIHTPQIKLHLSPNCDILLTQLVSFDILLQLQKLVSTSST